MSTSPRTIDVRSNPVGIAGPSHRLIVLHNSGDVPVQVGPSSQPDADTVNPGATVEYRYPAEGLSIVSATPTTVQVTYCEQTRDVVAYETGVPAELLVAGRDEAELRASAARIAAWKAA